MYNQLEVEWDGNKVGDARITNAAEITSAVKTAAEALTDTIPSGYTVTEVTLEVVDEPTAEFPGWVVIYITVQRDEDSTTWKSFAGGLHIDKLTGASS